MTKSLQVFSLLLAVGAGLTAAPTIAADGTLGRDEPAIPPPGSETWTLRPTKVPGATLASPRGSRTVTLSGLPNERRAVRVVYEGYGEASPLRPAR